MAFKYACFISYPHGQYDLTKIFIEQLKKALKNYLEPRLDEEVYIDEERLKPGYRFNEELACSLCESICMIVVYSPKYIRRDYCLRELAGMVKIEQQRKGLLGNVGYGRGMIIPIIFRGKSNELADELRQKINRTMHYCDFSKFTLASTDISQNPEYIREIEKICDVIEEHFRNFEKNKLLDRVCIECTGFQLPSEQEAKQWWGNEVPPAFPR